MNMETRIHTNGELEVCEYGQRTVYNLNGDIIYREEGNIIEEIEYSPTGELEIYRIRVGDTKCQYGSRGERIQIHNCNKDETIAKLRENSLYKLRTDGGQYRSDCELESEYLGWELWMEEEEQQRCPNYYYNLNNIF